MPVFLMIIGAVAAISGLAGIGFGIPVKEFSFGNTMIASGATAFAGGIVTLALGAAVSTLRRIADGMAHAPPVPFETPAAAPAVPPPPIAFPSRPKPAAFANATRERLATPPLAIPAAAPAPTLRNPDAPALSVSALDIPEKEGASLMPGEGSESPDIAPPAPPSDKFLGLPPDRHREPPPAFAEEPLTPPAPPPPHLEPASEATPPSYFDTMWPADSRAPKRPFAAELASKSDVPAEEPPPAEPAGILKSGVVDGMAYTLYTDGSIEAELPTGTLHFASINELRDHLAKNS